MGRLGSDAAIVAQHPAEPPGAFDRTDRLPFADIRLDQSVVEPLVIPLCVVVSGEFSCRLTKRPFPEEDHSVETLVLDRPNEAFGVGVQVGRTRRQADACCPDSRLTSIGVEE